MKYLKISALAIAFCAMYASCRYDKADELYVTTGCDTTAAVTFSGFVNGVVDQNCLNCHGNLNNTTLGASINLEGYDNLIAYVNDGPNGGSFMGAITHSPNNVAMPQGASQLDACTILKLQKWVNNGAQNN
jgi:hypothetical protein